MMVLIDGYLLLLLLWSDITLNSFGLNATNCETRDEVDAYKDVLGLYQTFLNDNDNEVGDDVSGDGCDDVCELVASRLYQVYTGKGNEGNTLEAIERCEQILTDHEALKAHEAHEAIDPEDSCIDKILKTISGYFKDTFIRLRNEKQVIMVTFEVEVNGTIKVVGFSVGYISMRSSNILFEGLLTYVILSERNLGMLSIQASCLKRNSFNRLISC